MSTPGDDLAAREAEVEQAREDLARTVDELTARLDVKARVRGKLTTDDGRPAPAVLAAGGVAALAVIGAVVLVVRRRRG